MTETTPRRLGKYELIEELGEGGFGKVFRACDTTLGGRPVALKILAPKLAWNLGALARFVQEAAVAARLEHPNIITIHEVGSTEGVHYIAMQLVEGRALSELLAEEGALTPAQLATIVGQIAQALDYAHDQGVLHGSIKPENILVEAGDRITVADFGLTLAAETSGLTHSGAAYSGQPEYAAPELLDPVHPAPASRAADVYSLGIVAYEMATGRVPFAGSSPTIVAAQLAEPPPPPETIRPDLDKGIGAVILGALGKAPAGRYASAGAFGTALEEAVAHADRAAQEGWLAEQIALARAELENGRLDDAKQRLESIIGQFPGADEPGALLSQVRHERRLTDLRRTLQTALHAQDWPGAVRAGLAIEALHEDYQDTRQLMGRARIELAREASAQSRWHEVVTECRAILSDAPDDAEAVRLLQDADQAQHRRPGLRWQIWAVFAGVTLLAIAGVALGRGRATPSALPSPPPVTRAAATGTAMAEVVRPSATTASPAATATARPLPTTTPRPPTPVPTDLPAAAVSALAADLYAGPGTAHTILSSWPKDTLLTVSGRDPTGAWLRVEEAQGAAGWVQVTDVEMGEAGAIPILTGLPTPDLGSNAGATRIATPDGMIMVFIPSGPFRMGVDDDRSDAEPNEKPQHEVYLDAFWIDRSEVTNAMYARCVAAKICTAPVEAKSYGRASYYDNPEFETYPVVNVSWAQAKTYCGWVRRRLPTEAEWEKAARGPDGRIYPWGNSAPDCTRANYWGKDGPCLPDTSPAGAYPTGASPYGVLDMAGNVWEWVADWYAPSYYGASPAKNPLGPPSGTVRVLRGGTWPYNEGSIRSTFRLSLDPGYIFVIVGFRCAESPSS